MDVNAHKGQKHSKRMLEDPCKRLMCEVEFWEVLLSKVPGF